MNLRNLYYMLSPNLRMTARKFYYFPSDLMNYIAGKNNKMIPPKGDIYTGSGDFTEQGHHHLELLKVLTDIKPDDTVLDVGSGIGRTAVALTNFLTRDGHYEGFDVVEKGIKWCNKNIKKNFPNFNFQYVPLKNDLYNKANTKAEYFLFPYPDNNFDIVFLFSVFTHMQPIEIDHYLFEIQRVLKNGGKCLATFFIFNKKEEENISKCNSFRFPFKKEGCRLMDKNIKCANVAFEEQTLFNIIKNKGFKITNIIYGYWKDINNKKDIADFQDIVVMTK